MPALGLDFLVDGFNVYHSLRDAGADFVREGAPQSTKWLDLKGLLENHLHVARAKVGPVDLHLVHYFSALAHHRTGRSPNGVADHSRYIDALRSTGVVPVLGRFKKAGKKKCSQCGFEIEPHVEKETDVSIAVRLLEGFMRDETDVVVLVTGDTDLVPAVKCAKQLFPTKFVGVLFPHRRKNIELIGVCDFYGSMSKALYARHQLPNPVELTPAGRQVHKPLDW